MSSPAANANACPLTDASQPQPLTASETVMAFLLFLAFILTLGAAEASYGDRAPYYYKCVKNCHEDNCTKDDSFDKFQPVHLKIMQWSCNDECKYECMWKIVALYQQREWDVPQFYGKWPFVRILGIQEPASTLFSIFNLFSHYVMLVKFRNEVRRSSPYFWMWICYAAVCLNAWFWSAIFHARDFPFTEIMDYFCAFSMVLFSFYCMVLRFLYGKSNVLKLIFSLLCIGFFINHIAYLMIDFNYGYNMKANITVGTANALGWLIWCWINRHSQPYSVNCAIFVILAGACTLFEIGDFPPIFWLVDAHALWHLGTAILPFFFYRFLIDDCKYLRKLEEAQIKKSHQP